MSEYSCEEEYNEAESNGAAAEAEAEQAQAEAEHDHRMELIKIAEEEIKEIYNEIQRYEAMIVECRCEIDKIWERAHK